MDTKKAWRKNFKVFTKSEVMPHYAWGLLR